MTVVSKNFALLRRSCVQGCDLTVSCQLSADICPLTFGERAPTACRHPVSGALSLPSSGCFSPFPHGTGSLSVTKEYLGLEGGPPNFRQGFTCPALLEDPTGRLPVRGCHPLWPLVPERSGFPNRTTGLVPFRSPLLRESRLISFPPATEMFQFAGFASYGYGFTAR